MDHRRIDGHMLDGTLGGREGSVTLARLFLSANHSVFRALAIQSFCFESKRVSGCQAGGQCFDSKQNAQPDNDHRRFDSKQDAAPNYRCSLSQRLTDTQARSWPYYAQRKGEMLMMS